ncbi:hypothetical protein BK798_02985 [Methanobrevibacter smithii]|uniref:Uncharacterized protein n=2 Tax=Methanobrevibacter smithii TaxID=2173 RepID=A0A2H4U5S7_METSM|nr:hypothetical protein BK798_02985 [Methanobrevibacter smithii]EEE41246.1 hypothetical protein METSMIALI_00128 [Methanobrevibacter smithii DSM 2375]
MMMFFVVYVVLILKIIIFSKLKMQLKRTLVEKTDGYGENGLIRIQMAKVNMDICFHIWTVKIWL